jgi:ferric-dicitrate binding protein FerR (iron transport regulator)
MTAPRYARLASKALAVETSGRPPTPDERAQAIAAMQDAIVRKNRRRREMRFLLGAAAAAVVAGSMAGAHFFRRAAPPPVQARSVAPPAPSENVAMTEVTIVAHPIGAADIVVQRPLAPLAGGWSLGSGSRVVTTRAGRAVLAFSTGTNVEIEEASDLTVDRADARQELQLDSGAVDLRVAALAASERFLVHTTDADIEVRGTRFRVAVVPADAACGGGTATRVSVSEGVVVIRHAGVETSVRRGQQWPAGCVPSAAASVSPSSRAPAAPTALSTLAAQNDLFGQALAAKRSGDPSGAVARFDVFLAQYPSSPLVESAEVERMRILRDVDPALAAAAATRYLARYPSGFGRAQAAAILAENR